MIKLDVAARINIGDLNKYLYKFKSKDKFEKEFDFRLGYTLGKGAFGIVKKCFSKRKKMYFAVK